jgi:hypothetical protein
LCENTYLGAIEYRIGSPTFRAGILILARIVLTTLSENLMPAPPCGA